MLVADLGVGAAVDTSLVGGKAMGLQRLLGAGLPCPPAFVVTTAALDAYLDEGGLRARLIALLEAGDADGLRSIAFEAELPIALQAELMTAVERLPGVDLVAVRSSAADEDGGSHSFAGLHETQLGVPLKGIGAAVRKCWASLWAEGAIAYRSEGGLAAGVATMAVVVQALVPARASAVVFTANPLTGATDEVVLHITCGLGPTLVDNEVTPDIAVVAKSDLSLRSFEIGDKHLRIDPRAKGGLVRKRSASGAPAVSEAELLDLAKLAIEAEQRLRTPIDIEAAMADSWQLIQARPITTLAAA